MTPASFFRQLPPTVTWETLDVEEVWSAIEAVLPQLDTPTQVTLVGEVITRLAELFVTAAEQVFEELDATTTQDGPVMTIQQFLPYVRQNMEIDFSQFVGGFEREAARGSYAPRKAVPEDLGDEQTLVATVDPVTLADAVEWLEAAQPENLDLEAALELAHLEDVEAWARAITAYFETAEVETVSLQMLQQSLALHWIEVWLGLLLGGYELEQRGTDFYAGDIWVRHRLSVPIEPTVEEGDNSPR